MALCTPSSFKTIIHMKMNDCLSRSSQITFILNLFYIYFGLYVTVFEFTGCWCKFPAAMSIFKNTSSTLNKLSWVYFGIEYERKQPDMTNHVFQWQISWWCFVLWFPSKVRQYNEHEKFMWPDENGKNLPKFTKMSTKHIMQCLGAVLVARWIYCHHWPYCMFSSNPSNCNKTITQTPLTSRVEER